MNIPENLYYSNEHEWIRIEGTTAWVGITDFAQHSVGDIVFVELPETGTSVAIMGKVAVVESVKAVSDIFCPLSGTIVEVNADLETSPELINSSPYDSYIFAIELTDPAQIENLLSPSEYAKLCEAGIS